MDTPQKKSSWNIDISLGGVSDVDIMMFTKHLSVILKSGLTLIDGLEILIEEAKGKFKKVLTEIYNTIKSGESFYHALEKYSRYFSPMYINMIRIGEKTGTLVENLERLSIELNKSHVLKKKIRSAMIYPSFVFIAVFGLGMSVALFVLPKILPLFRAIDVKLPITTQGLIWVAELFEVHGGKIFIASIITIIFLSWLLRRNFIKPITHRVILKIPVVREIIKNVNLEKITRTFGILLESGLTVDESLHIASNATENRMYQAAIASFIPDIEAGKTLGSSIAKHPELFPLITARMVRVGENTGNLDNSLKYLSHFYEDAVDEATKNLSTMIEPILLITIGIIVAIVAIAILGPIYEITGNLRT